VDQLMPMLETPAIDEVIKLRELDLRKAALKRALRHVAGATRNFKGGLQRRMHAVPDTGEMKQEERQGLEGQGNGAASDELGVANMENGVLEKIRLACSSGKLSDAKRNRLPQVRRRQETVFL
jgi:hypothetical protein